MEYLMRRSPLLTFLLLLMPLAGCETLGLTSPSPDELVADTGPICPSTAVLSDAVTVTKLKPGTQAALPNPANVAFTAEMSQAKLDCDYDRAQARRHRSRSAGRFFRGRGGRRQQHRQQDRVSRPGGSRRPHNQYLYPERAQF